MLWTLPPLILVIAQLQFHYGYEGFAPGQTTLLHVVLKPDHASSQKPAIGVEAPAGVRIVEPPVWVPSLREMAWRVEIEARGHFELAISSGDTTVVKSLDTDQALARRSPIRSRGFVDELLYPAEAALPAESPFETIRLDYAEAAVDFFGFAVHWMIAFFVLSIAFAFVLRKPFGVTL
jgi:hypothetical protein